MHFFISLLFMVIACMNTQSNVTKYEPHQQPGSLFKSNENRIESFAVTLCNVMKNRHILEKHHKDKITLIYIFTLLICQASNVESNPGPQASQYPCGYCAEEVTWSEKGILCESCDQWYHTVCQGIGDSTYEKLSDSRHVWLCLKCGLPNYSSSLAESLDTLSDFNTFSVLELSSELQSQDISTSQSMTQSIPTPSDNSFLQVRPKHTSTPRSKDPNKVKGTSQKIPKMKCKRSEERLTILNINCRSIKNKIPDFHMLLEQVNPDIIACSETWLKPEVNTSEIFPANSQYAVFRDDRIGSKGGGVLLAISKRLVCQEKPELRTDCNIVWSKISVPGIKDIYVSSYYKPHENDADSLSSLWESIQKIPKNSNIWVLGDFNLPEINWDSETIKDSCKHKPLYNSFMENLTSFNLNQMVKVPTRDNNILDLFLTNQPCHVHSTKTLPSLGTSDHNIVFHEMKVKIGRSLQVQREIKLFGRAKWDDFKRELSTYHENVFMKLSDKDPNSLWLSFKATITELSKKYIPTKITKPKCDLPWITKKIVKLIRKRDKLYHKCKISIGSAKYKQTRDKFNVLKTIIQRLIRQSYWEYLESVIFSNDSGNGVNKKFYSFVKHKKTDNHGVSPLKSEGKTFTSADDKARILNEQFVSAFSKPKPPSLSQLCELNIFENEGRQSTGVMMSDITISNDGVLKLLKSLNPNKASGPDQLSPKLLKELCYEVAPFLTKIFQVSLQTGIVPDDWKTAAVAPVYKKGPKCKASNYRPISLTCISSKLMEHILVSNIMNYLESNGLLTSLQHGFRSKHSCETQLLSFTQEIFDNLEAGKQTDLIVMDFSKAFDKVDHQLLIYKLMKLGINRCIISWIRSFLSGRTQTVVVEGHQSGSVPVLSGVPQGSVVGPSLFLCYINDLPDSVKSRVRLFADDTIIYLTIDSSSDSQKLQEDLEQLEIWENKWAMEFNPDKCEIIRISKKRNTIAFPYRLHGTELKTTKNAKYLGVTISDDFSWKKHIENVSSKANNTLKFIKRNIQCNNKKIKETAYKTYVRPQLEYCSTVWHPWQKNLSYELEKVQRAAARYVTNDYSHFSSVSTMLHNLHWQTLEQRRKYASLIIFYKISNNIIAVDHNHLTRSRNLNYIIPFSRTQYHMNSFFPRTIRLWNDLPHYIKASDSLNGFTECLNSHQF